MNSMQHRRPDLVEAMDRPDCDPKRLRRTYVQFGLMNRCVAGWRRVYVKRVRPLILDGKIGGRAGEPLRLLDIGCGGGDVALAFANWAKRNQLELAITAADPDPRAFAFMQNRSEFPASIERVQATLGALFEQGRRFDVVISNHVLHHLNPEELQRFRADSERIATTLVLHNDLERARIAWVGLQLMRPVFPGSFIIPDGSLSLRRSFRRSELATLLGPRWQVRRRWPYRLWAEFEVGSVPLREANTSPTVTESAR